MRVLVACEFSGRVAQAFRDRGHDAWSCDLLPSDLCTATPEQHKRQQGDCCGHIIADALTVIQPGAWDQMIAHPPCTYLCNSGVRWLAPCGKVDAERYRLMMLAADFFAALYWSKIPQVAVENPVMHCYARDYLRTRWQVPTYSQTFQPWQHGEPEVKRTCLWLRGLPLLKPSNVVAGREARIHKASPGPDRWKERSRTLPGIARAMAEQWG